MCKNNPIISINIPKSVKYTDYIFLTIFDSFLINKITEENLLKHLNNIITEIKEDKCVICKETKKVIRICKYKDHCYCPYCFCSWYKNHEKKCLLCPKEFEFPL